MLAAREARTFSVVVLTTRPSLRGVVHAAWILGIPSISTRHMRHWPTTVSRGWKQKWGISTPASFAASIRLMPGGTSPAFPSKMTVTVSFFGGAGLGATGVAGVLIRTPRPPRGARRGTAGARRDGGTRRETFRS